MRGSALPSTRLRRVSRPVLCVLVPFCLLRSCRVHVTDVRQRATTTGLVLSGLGLSAFLFSLLARTLFPGDTSALLLMLAIGTATPMLMGLFIVTPVPLPPTSSNARDGTTIEGYDPIPSEDAVVFVGEGQVMLGPEVDTEADAESAPLLSNEQESSLHRERGVGDKDLLPDIHGKRLWLTPDFYLVFVIMGICRWPPQIFGIDAYSPTIGSGTGIMCQCI